MNSKVAALNSDVAVRNAETPLGYASDITRTWPVSGKFSATQRDIYDIVLAAHDACIAKVAPDVEYQDIHLLACRMIEEFVLKMMF